MPLVHGQEISSGEVERELSSWDATRFARLCNCIAWATTWADAQTLPAFTERVIVGDNGIDAEWRAELTGIGDGQFLRDGGNVFQYKKREVTQRRRQTIVTAMANELRGAALEVEQRSGTTIRSYVLFTNVDLTVAQ